MSEPLGGGQFGFSFEGDDGIVGIVILVGRGSLIRVVVPEHPFIP